MHCEERCAFLGTDSVSARGGEGGFGPGQACGGQGGLGRIRVEAEILKGRVLQSAGVVTIVVRKRQFVVSSQNVQKRRVLS
jgi:hypothetical protein